MMIYCHKWAKSNFFYIFNFDFSCPRVYSVNTILTSKTRMLTFDFRQFGFNIICLPTPSIFLQVKNENTIVRDSAGKEVESQLLPLTNAQTTLRNYHVKAYLGQNPSETPGYWLVFTASAPPLGFSSYTISSVKMAGLFISMFYYTINGQTEKC